MSSGAGPAAWGGSGRRLSALLLLPGVSLMRSTASSSDSNGPNGPTTQRPAPTRDVTKHQQVTAAHQHQQQQQHPHVRSADRHTKRHQSTANGDRKPPTESIGGACWNRRSRQKQANKPTSQ